LNAQDDLDLAHLCAARGEETAASVAMKSLRIMTFSSDETCEPRHPAISPVGGAAIVKKRHAREFN
jgi:hypothetical protein